MQRFFRIFLAGIIISASFSNTLRAQTTDTTHPVSVNPELQNILTAKIPKEYIIAGVKVVGTKYLDESLLLSISGINVGGSRACLAMFRSILSG